MPGLAVDFQKLLRSVSQVKCFLLDKSMGAMGNIILYGMMKAGVREDVT